MVFSSISFLYYFLPLCILCYFLIPKKFRNFVLLIFSLFFYFYGESKYIIVLIFSCILNYYSGKLIIKYPMQKKFWLIANLAINFGLLFYFKYFNFFITNINALFHINFSLFHIIMPIGISFFTFQATSYVIDIYKGKIRRVYFPRQSIYYTYGIKIFKPEYCWRERRRSFMKKYMLPLKLKMYYYLRKK